VIKIIIEVLMILMKKMDDDLDDGEGKN